MALSIAHILIQSKLHALAHTHLMVRIHERTLFIYSMENNEEAYRAALTMFPGNRFILSIANHRGHWQPMPFIGSAQELLPVLTKKFAFALARWS